LQLTITTTFNVSHLFHRSIVILQHNTQAQWRSCSILGRA